MEIQIGKKSCPTPFVIVKARRCGSNSLVNWLEENIGVDNYLDLSGDNGFINYDLFDIIEDDMNTSIKNIRKNYIKTSERKQRQELSLSASRGLTRHKGKHIVRFD